MNNKYSKRIIINIHQNLFRYSLFIKGFDGFIEFGIGTILLLIRPETINKIILYYVHNELLEEPHNKLANFFLQHGHISASGATFTAVLLMLRGLIKFLVISGLLERKTWVYPVAIIVFLAFVVFQMYTYVYNHSLFLLVISTFDLFVIALTVREYINLSKTGRAN